MEESNIILFFGRFHPLLVHLPIGFLLLAVMLEVAERMSWVKEAKSATIFTLLLGTLSAVAATVLGLMLATSGDYNGEMLDAHKWAGFATTGIALVAFLIKAEILKLQQMVYFGALGVMVAVMSATGHLGGNLTHGTDYLTYYMPFKPKVVDPLDRPPVKTLAEAQVFGDMVHPIIKSKCMSCHNNQKKKGQLSFASIEDYLAGGKHGDLFVAGDIDASQLIERITLPEGHDDIMPPDGKTPLSEEEIAVLSFWVDKANGSFEVTLDSIDLEEEFVAIAEKQLGLGHGHGAHSNVQLAEVDSAVLENLRAKGFEIRELVAGSNALDVTLSSSVSDSNKIEDFLASLEPIKENIYWLSLNKTGLSGEQIMVVKQFSQVRVLKLANNKIDDQAVSQLSQLEYLESINLYGTEVTTESIKTLGKLPTLKSVYVWGSKLTAEELAAVKKEYPAIKIIGGA
ncbi:c-type cytochrome domain-containing protein [Reichenbachiella versicolor]|uniref:c-type cytochrome domain-containing protein n=1 Tax=Reichenbachiella versicolor TaxID=1821036 RepID=UPI000D6E2AE9|nr:c-type cytochrome domain-containing protein [Reichenbachiella versicolor]